MDRNASIAEALVWTPGPYTQQRTPGPLECYTITRHVLEYLATSYVHRERLGHRLATVQVVCESLDASAARCLSNHEILTIDSILKALLTSADLDLVVEAVCLCRLPKLTPELILAGIDRMRADFDAMLNRRALGFPSDAFPMNT